MSAPWYIVMITPVDYREAINKCGAALNYGWTNFSLRLVTPPDTDTVTDYACDAGGSNFFKTLIEAAHEGTLPPGIVWEDFDLTEEEAAEAFANTSFVAVEYPVDGEREKFLEILSSLGKAVKVEEDAA